MTDRSAKATGHGAPVSALDDLQRELVAEVPGYAEAAAAEAEGRAFCDAVRADLKRQREAAGLTQAEIAARMGVSASSVSHFEKGEGNAGLMTLWRYARALGTDLHVTLGRTAAAADSVSRAEADSMTVMAAVETALRLVAGSAPTAARPVAYDASGFPVVEVPATYKEGMPAFAGGRAAGAPMTGGDLMMGGFDYMMGGPDFMMGGFDYSETVRQFTTLHDTLVRYGPSALAGGAEDDRT